MTPKLLLKAYGAADVDAPRVIARGAPVHSSPILTRHLNGDCQRPLALSVTALHVHFIRFLIRALQSRGRTFKINRHISLHRLDVGYASGNKP